MITCITYDNLHRTGAAFADHFALRQRCFVDRQGYDVRTWRGREFDRYDTPASIYLVYDAGGGRVLGASRLTPVSQGCMVRDLWPQMLADPAALDGDDVWEGTRFCVDKSLAPWLRRRIASELVLAYFEVGLAAGVRRIVGVMQSMILRRVFADAGVACAPLGPVLPVDGQRLQAAAMEISRSHLMAVRDALGVTRSVVRNPAAAEALRAERRGPRIIGHVA
jgi:acyl homoserine lactone synthase